MTKLQVRELLRFVLIMVSLFLFSANVVGASTYYVAKTGADGNPGTESQPWLTIQKAARVLAAGDTVVIGPGLYEETVYVTSHNGDKDNPIVFKSAGEMVFKGNWYVGSWGTPRHFITLEGIHFVNSNIRLRGDFNVIQNCVFEGPTGGLRISGHPTAEPPSSNVTIQNNTFRDFGKVVVVATGTKSSNVMIRNNTWTNIEGDVIRMFGNGHIFRGNVVSGLKETGWHADIFQVYDTNGENSTNMLIENNVFKNSTGSLCMVLNRGGSNISNWTWRNNVIWNVGGVGQVSVPYFKFYNNTFVFSGRNTAGPLLFRYYGSSQYSYAHHTTVKNNLFIGCGSQPDGDKNGWYHFIDKPIEAFHDLDIDYNYVTKSKSASYDPKGDFYEKEIHGINGGDPKFENSDTGDFRLRKGSPAIDSGVTIDSFAVDFEGTKRPQGNKWDRGAFERKAKEGSITPPLPENLRIVLK